MKKIIYTRVDGGLTVDHPAEGARLALQVQLADGTILKPDGAEAPADTFLRGWPVEGAKATWAETEEEFIARVVKKVVPADATDVQIVEASVIPLDRTFRNAWKAGVGRIEHDMTECRSIQRDRLRQMRQPLLQRLDIEFMMAVEAGDLAKQANIAAKKQALRDVTADPRLEPSKTPEELKAVIPVVLTCA